ncbi:hypothetical protein OIE68_25740 [Nocardia vinacea]|uniref:SnoaL-like domain-containing protein n=1 Tax=Nocardia vinacea TaxID=96468 RepID=A0ABZ1Z4C9_9NOCA|nr:hypothetical protein OIE68_25740 [Nocardia vinacea]
MTTRAEIEAYLVEYQEALSAFDAQRSVAQWGAPGTMVSDAFVGTVATTAEMAEGLEQSYPLYQSLGLASVDHTVLEHVDLSERITRIHVRWHFYDIEGNLLTDSDYEYLLRRDDDGQLRAYVAVAIDEMDKIAELAAAKGIQL